MNSTAIKLIAVVAVVAVVVGAVAVIFVNQGGSDSKYNIGAMLPVYGNANEDYTINQADLDIIQNIVDKKDGFTATKYPFADANYDGTVNSADVTLVKNILNKKPCDVYVINKNTNNTEYGNAKEYVDVVHWPVKAAFSAGVSTLPMLYKCTGVLDYIKGMALSDPWNCDPVLFPQLKDFKSLGPNMREFDVQKTRDALKENPDVNAIICVASLKDNEPIFKQMGLSIIRPDCSAPTVDGYTRAMLLLGFVFDTPTQSLEVSEFFKDIKDTIDEKTKNVTKAKAIVISATGGASVQSPTSNYAQNVIVAGGEFPDIIKDKTSSTPFGDWIYTMKDCDVVLDFHSGSSDNSWFNNECDESEYAQAIKEYKDTTMFKNKRAYVIAFDLPMPIKIAYCAAALYPDELGEKWAENLAQKFYDKFFSPTKLDVKKLNVFLDTDEILSL